MSKRWWRDRAMRHVCGRKEGAGGTISPWALVFRLRLGSLKEAFWVPPPSITQPTTLTTKWRWTWVFDGWPIPASWADGMLGHYEFHWVISSHQAPLPLRWECPQIGTQPLFAMKDVNGTHKSWIWGKIQRHLTHTHTQNTTAQYYFSNFH